MKPNDEPVTGLMDISSDNGRTSLSGLRPTPSLPPPCWTLEPAASSSGGEEEQLRVLTAAQVKWIISPLLIPPVHPCTTASSDFWASPGLTWESWLLTVASSISHRLFAAAVIVLRLPHAMTTKVWLASLFQGHLFSSFMVTFFFFFCFETGFPM